MPAVSQAQAGLMALATTEYGRRKLRASGKKPPPVSVAKEFTQASKGVSIRDLPKRVKKK
jgi:hypothetical protein